MNRTFKASGSKGDSDIGACMQPFDPHKIYFTVMPQGSKIHAY